MTFDIQIPVAVSLRVSDTLTWTQEFFCQQEMKESCCNEVMHGNTDYKVKLFCGPIDLTWVKVAEDESLSYDRTNDLLSPVKITQVKNKLVCNDPKMWCC